MLNIYWKCINLLSVRSVRFCSFSTLAMLYSSIRIPHYLLCCLFGCCNRRVLLNKQHNGGVHCNIAISFAKLSHYFANRSSWAPNPMCTANTFNVQMNMLLVGKWNVTRCNQSKCEAEGRSGGDLIRRFLASRYVTILSYWRCTTQTTHDMHAAWLTDIRRVALKMCPLSARKQ